METINHTTLRLARNSANLYGYLKKLDLKEGKNRNGVDTISGTLTIMTAPGSDHDISVYAAKTTREGKENKAYAGLQTVMAEYVSIASLLGQKRDMDTAMRECTKLSTSYATLSRSEYVNQAGMFVSRRQISGNYFSRISDDSFNAGDCRATFDVECYLTAIADETDADGNDTGRKLVNAYIPVFGGVIIPFEFVVPADVAAAFDAMYEPGQTALFTGDIVNQVVTEAAPKGGFGRPVENRTYIHEFRIMGGDPPYDEDDPKAYASDAIRKAEGVRNAETIPAIKNRTRDSAAPKPSAGFGSPASSDPALAQAAAGFTY